MATPSDATDARRARSLGVRLFVFGVVLAAVFSVIGGNASTALNRLYVSPPRAMMTLGIVETSDVPVLTSVFLAKDIAEAAGIDEIVLARTKYRTKQVPMLPWRAGGLLVKQDSPPQLLRYTHGSWHLADSERDLSEAASSLFRDFERSDAVTASVRRCRDLVGSGLIPAIILQPLGWLLGTLIPIGTIACVTLLLRWLRRVRSCDDA